MAPRRAPDTSRCTDTCPGSTRGGLSRRSRPRVAGLTGRARRALWRVRRIEPPKRHASVDLDVTSVNGADVRLLFDACRTWGDLLCLQRSPYLGPRRGAVSKLRWRDVDLSRGTMRFREKGAKTIAKAIPDDFAGLLHAAVASEDLDISPGA